MRPLIIPKETKNKLLNLIMKPVTWYSSVKSSSKKSKKTKWNSCTAKKGKALKTYRIQ